MRRTVVAVAILLSMSVPGAAFAGEAPAAAPGGSGATASGAGSGDSTGSPKGPTMGGTDPANDALMSSQARLADAAGRLDAAVGTMAGFTGIELDTAGLILRWKGSPPAKASAAIARARVAVRVVSARYSLAELRAAAGQVVREVEAGRGNGVHGIAIEPDGRGLRLAVAASGQNLSSAQPTTAQRSAAADLARTAGTSVATRVVVEPRTTQYSRQNDFAPWAGGIVIANHASGSRFYGVQCTGGIGVRSGSTSYLVTASHCGDYPDLIVDGAGDTVGRVYYRDGDQGVELVSASSVSGEIYVGGGTLFGGSQGIKGVSGWSAPYKGQSLCASAAVTGQYCGLVVFDTEEYRCGSEPNIPFKCWGPLVGVERTSGAIAGRPGDSGGPIYFNSSTRANIVGTILGGDGAAIMWIVSARKISEAFDGVGDPVDLNLTIATRSY